MSTPRRRFIQSAAGLTAGLSFAGGSTSGSPVLPTVPLGKHQITRLIIGHNPMYGFSHFNNLFSAHMSEWYTPDRVCQVLRQCEQNGINTWQHSCRERILSDLRKYRDEGGKLQSIIVSQADMEGDPARIRAVAELKPIGMVHHGGSTDRKWRSGKLSLVRDFINMVRDAGVPAGACTHNPMVVEELEERGWGADFYMTCVYNVTRTPEEIEKLLGQKPLGELFLERDPERMYKTLRQVKKTCLAFKILAAGRLIDKPQQVDKAFETALTNIKPQDALIVGMYPRYSDQVKENAERVRRILAPKTVKQTPGTRSLSYSQV
jgi:hypothetical protein